MIESLTCMKVQKLYCLFLVKLSIVSCTGKYESVDGRLSCIAIFAPQTQGFPHKRLYTNQNFEVGQFKNADCKITLHEFRISRKLTNPTATDSLQKSRTFSKKNLHCNYCNIRFLDHKVSPTVSCPPHKTVLLDALLIHSRFKISCMASQF